MHIEFSFTEQDALDFNLYHFAHSPTERRSALLSRLATAFLTLLVCTAIVFLFDRTLGWTQLVFPVVAGIVAFVIFPWVLRREVVSKFHKLMKEGDNSAAFGPETLTLSDEGIFEQDQLGERRYNWSAVQRMAESGGHIFLYVSATKALVIPARAFASEAMKQEFVQMVKAHSRVS